MPALHVQRFLRATGHMHRVAQTFEHVSRRARNFWPIIHHQDRLVATALDGPLAHLLGRHQKIESYIFVPIMRKDGEYFGNLCAIDRHPRKVSDPQTQATFTIFADLIAMLLNSEDQLQASNQARLDEKATSDLREQFIAVLGHDLRNPLSAVSTTAELLIRRPEPDVVRLGERLKSTSRRMAKLINDVLDFARGRLGTGIKVALESHPDMASAFLEVITELRQAHPDRN